MVRAFQESGESVEALAERHGLAEVRVQRWVKQVAERDRRRERVSFVSVRLVERAPEQGDGVEIASASGWSAFARREDDGQGERRCGLPHVPGHGPLMTTSALSSSARAETAPAR